MIATSLALAVVVSAVPVQEAPAPDPAPKATATAPAWPAPAKDATSEAPRNNSADTKKDDEKKYTPKEGTTETTPANPFAAPTTAPTVTAPPAKPAPATTGQASSPWSFAGWLLYADPEQQTGSFAPSMFGGTAPGTAQASSSPWWALTPLSFLFGGPTQLAPEQTNPAPATEPAPEATGTPEPVSVADLIPSGTATSTTAGAEGDAGDDTASAPAATETATK